MNHISSKKNYLFLLPRNISEYYYLMINVRFLLMIGFYFFISPNIKIDLDLLS